MLSSPSSCYVTMSCMSRPCVTVLYVLVSLVRLLSVYLLSCSDDEYAAAERPDDVVKVLVSPMLGEVFKVRIEIIVKKVIHRNLNIRISVEFNTKSKVKNV